MSLSQPWVHPPPLSTTRGSRFACEMQPVPMQRFISTPGVGKAKIGSANARARRAVVIFMAIRHSQ
ncbi:hypothetical protein BD410DRAFT_797334 [Rickenella mellea]|uniref:Uncharacterized protein n=1 Tax=Rickenella mellea TaxID=50990 RepID=A0A4Y7PGD3_9AGAM|nr:hypothetical protein BD410DRAFT_797334 [Rickenella mellea]